MSYKISLNIDILTPVIIASGNVLSPIEYIVVGKTYYRLSEEVYEKVLSKSYNLNRNIYHLLSGRIDSYTYNILRRHAHEYSLYSMTIDTSATGKIAGSIIEHIKDYRYRTVIPPSTVKGFIRTSLLYYFLKVDKAFFNEACKRIEEALSEINTSLIVGNYRHARRDSKRVSEGIEKMVFKVGNSDILRFLNVSLNRVDGLENVLSELKVIRKGNRQIISQQSAEFIRKGRFEYIISVNIGEFKIRDEDIEIYNTYVEKARRILDKENLLAALKTYSKDVFEYEKSILKNIFDLNKFNNYFNENSFIARIGFGSGHLWKTIALLLINNNKPLYNRLTNTMSKLYGRKWDLSSVKLYSGSIEVPLGFTLMKIKEVI